MSNNSKIVRYGLPIATLAFGVILGMMLMFGMFVIGIIQFIEVFDSPITIDVNETMAIDYFLIEMNRTYGVDMNITEPEYASVDSDGYLWCKSTDRYTCCNETRCKCCE